MFLVLPRLQAAHQPKQPYHDFVNITARINIYNNNLKRAID